jgi:hypothetical protein
MFVVASGPALANGRMPNANQLVVDPSDAKYLVLRSTYGLVVSADGGSTWEWICEAAMSYGGLIEDPPIAIAADGSIVVGTTLGIRISHDHGCTWSAPAGLAGTTTIIDLSMRRSDPSQGVAIATYDVDAGHTSIELYATTDNGATWAFVSSMPTDWTYVATVDVAPSNPARIYVTGSGRKPLDGLFGRSDDGGKTWTTSALGTGTDVLYIGAIDPHDPDRVYARLDSDPSNRLFLSTNGISFREVFDIDQKMLGFALSPDGTSIVLGGPSGLWVGSAGDPIQLDRASSFGPVCLTWSDAGIYGCADQVLADYELGISIDRGTSMRPVYRLTDLKQSSCSPSTTTGSICPPYSSPDGDAAAEADVEAGSDAALDAAVDAGRPKSNDASSCGCRMPRGAGGRPAVGYLTLAMAALRRRVRRTRAARRVPPS